MLAWLRIKRKIKAGYMCSDCFPSASRRPASSLRSWTSQSVHGKTGEKGVEDRAAVGDARRTQVVIVPSDYAQDGNQSTFSFEREDHGWQGGRGRERAGRGERDRGWRRESHKGWQILLGRAEGANSRALTGWCKPTLGEEAGEGNWAGGTERQNIKAIRGRRKVGKGAGGWKEMEGKSKKYKTKQTNKQKSLTAADSHRCFRLILQWTSFDGFQQLITWVKVIKTGMCL